MTLRETCIFFQFFFLLLTAAVSQESGAACKTSGGQDGRCINVKSCPTVLKTLLETRNLTDPVLQDLRGAHCGIFNGEHHVCCESSNVRRSEEASKESVDAGLAILVDTPCGKNEANRVANGVDAEVSENPWMVLLQYSGKFGKSFDCGGSLITSRYVLTAAHCLDVPSRQLIGVRLGEHDLNEERDCRKGRSKYCAPPVQDIPIEEAIFHKDYNNIRFHNDIGLIRLAWEATLNSGVSPICLPVTAASKATTINRLIISGWGTTETRRRSTILQKALVTPIENAECQETFKSLVISENQMCAAGENEVDACKGDSGGPAVYSSRYLRGARFVQYGIVSAGVVQCGSTFPGIYVRTLAYLDWIAGNIKP